MLKSILGSRAVNYFLSLTILLCCFKRSSATVWTTITPGHVYDLSNWTNGTSAPATFATPGDTWIITLPMDLATTGYWEVGTASAVPSTVLLPSNGSLLIDTITSFGSLNIHGNLNITGGIIYIGSISSVIFFIDNDFSMSDGEIRNINNFTHLNINVAGNTTISGGAINVSGTSDAVVIGTMNCDLSGGALNTSGSGCNTEIDATGNLSCSGAFAMTNVIGNTSNIHLAGTSGTQMISNISTGSWSNTDIYVDGPATAQLADNFSTNTGGSTNGLTVGGILICPTGFQVTGAGIFTLASGATLKVASPAGINGAIVTTGTIILDIDGHYVFNGTAAQVTGTLLPLVLLADGTLEIANSAGVTLSQTVSLNGALNFVSGILHTGPFAIAAAGSVTGAGPASYVEGTLIKPILLSLDVDYEVGDVSYAPLRLTLSSISSAGGLGVRAVSGLHPSVSTSLLTATNMVNHYWTVSNAGATLTEITPKATYNAGDIIGGSNSSFLTQFYVSGSWLINPLATTNTATPYTSTPTSGIISLLTSADVIFGNDCGIPITGPSNVCVGTPITLAGAGGGTWSSSSPTLATVSSGGLVTGLFSGTVVISYTVPGCLAVKEITITSMPDAGTITGSDTVCISNNIFLASTVTGGAWISSDPSIALVGPTTGMVTGVGTGVAMISYSKTNDCGTAQTTHAVNVYSEAHCGLAAGNLSVASSGLEVYPNPNNGSFQTQFISPVNQSVHFNIADVTGRIVRSMTTLSNAETIVTINIPGIYIITASTDEGKRYTTKVLVTN